MAIPPGTYSLGPECGTLSVRTGRTGAAAKAGHDLLLEVTAWTATLQVGDETTVVLEADAGSLRVREGTGGMKELDDDDRANIEQTIDDEVLKRQGIEFRSTSVQAADGRLGVQGELTLLGSAAPLAFDVVVGDDGKLSGSAIVRQTAWGIKPYSALFGALKVADEVEIEFEAALPAAQSA